MTKETADTLLEISLDENPIVKSYLGSIGAKMYYCERSNEFRVSGEKDDEEFDLSLELFVTICKSIQDEQKPKLTRVK